MSYIFMGLLFLFLIKNININPVSVGLKPILENPLYKSVKEIKDKDPEAKWVWWTTTWVTGMYDLRTHLDWLNGRSVESIPRYYHHSG